MPKKDNPGGGGGGGGDVAFVVKGLSHDGTALIGTFDPSVVTITVSVANADGTTWEGTADVASNGTWSIDLNKLLNTDPTAPRDDFSDETGNFTVVASYEQINARNDKIKTVYTEETALFLSNDNSAPVAFDDAKSTDENTVLESAVPAALDVDGTIASYALIGVVQEGSLTFGTDGSYTFDPGSDFDDLGVNETRNVTFTYTATDNDGLVSGIQTVTITVTGSNDAPVAFDDAKSTEENANLVSAVPAATDVDGTIASYALVGDVQEGSLTFQANGSYSFDPGSAFDDLAAGATRDVTFTYTATDNDGLVSGIQTVTITVTNVVETPPPTAYTNVAVFGDSLSDNGNFSDLAALFFVRDEEGGLIYTVPFQYDGGDGSVRTYDARSFTDGTTYADTLAGLLSLDAAYENYAFGGAEALGSKLGSGYINEYANLTYTTATGGTATFSIIEDTETALAAYGNFDINLTAQVTRFIADNPDGAPDGTLAVLNIGGNDLSNFDTSFWNILFGGVNDFASDLGVQIETQARRLVTETGVSGIALYTLPVADFFVGSDELSWLEAPVAEDLLNSVNDEILYRGQLLNTDPGLAITAEVIRLDIMSEELLADMQTHGFLYKGPYLQGYSGDPLWVETSYGVIEPVFTVNTAATSYRAEQILFFDEIHPSGALHDMLAVFSSESLSTDQVFGSGGADILTMSAADDFVLARGGNDEINLGAGDDVALGGTGDDTLRGEDGSDLLIGGAGNDSLEGGGGSDLLAGSAGNDKLLGGAEADLLIGGLGSDVVLGEAGDDVFIFFEEELWGGNGGSDDFYDGGDGENDILLVFLLSDRGNVAQEVTGTTTTLSFGDTSTLTAVNIETIELFMGLPEDAESPLTTLALSMSDDLLARYEEGELWGIV